MSATNRGGWAGRILAAGASGVMLAALFPHFRLSFLAWVALLPLLLVARSSSPRAAGAYGLLTGIVFFSILLEWIRIFDSTGWVLLTLWQAGYLAAFAFLLRVLSPRVGGWSGIVMPAVIWTGLEWVRSLGRGGFTWGDLAYAFRDTLPLLQVTSILGPFGLSFLVMLANAALAAFLVSWWQKKDRGAAPSLRPAAGHLAAVAVLILGAWAWGSWRLAQPLPPGKTLRVAVLQGHVSGEGQDEPWSDSKIYDSVRVYLDLTERAARSGVDVIFWPETAVPDFLERNPVVRDSIALTAARLGIDLIVGASYQDPKGDLRNSAYLFDREGKIAGRYDKVQLVPYGEFTPFRKQLAFLYRYFPIRNMDYSSGDGFFPLRTAAAPVGVAICFESAFPRIGRALRASGAEVLAIITNDAWFGRRSATWQHYDMAGFRAVENGCYVARAATTGFSAIVDPRGRVVAETPLFERKVLVSEVRRSSQPTLYARVGDIVGWASALTVALLLLARRRRAPGA